MENSLVKTTMNLPDIMNMAKTFAESGMFADAKGMAQAFVKIQAGQEIGIPPFAAMSGIHLIQGKLTLGAGLIASTVKASGKYDYKVKELTEKICSLDFYQINSFIGNSTFTIEDAKKAGTKNLEKFPKNMLFARAISNGVKWYCPDVFAGPVYVPEEMEQTIDIKHEVVENKIQEIGKVVEMKPLSESKFLSAIAKIEKNENIENVLNALKKCNLSKEQKEKIDLILFETMKNFTAEEMIKQPEILNIWTLPNDMVEFLIDSFQPQTIEENGTNN